MKREQPAPAQGQATPTWELVMEDMRARDAMGAERYGVRHQHDNGRNHLVDAYEEALDLVVYLRAQIESQRVLREELQDAALAIERLEALVLHHREARDSWKAKAEKWKAKAKEVDDDAR